MENKNEVVYFSVNNWGYEYYPLTENFKKWLGDDLNQSFRNDEWCKENKLCVYYGIIDMSQNYTISASREWVEKNCPELLTDNEYSYITQQVKPKKNLFGGYDYVVESVEVKKKYSDFVYIPEEGEDLPDNDRIGEMPFREYCEENFGAKYYDTHYWEDYDDEDYDDEDDD